MATMMNGPIQRSNIEYPIHKNSDFERDFQG